ncbi:Leucine-rich repeat and death domain-containing protein [Danaus plexippus plexippus]|uniref:Leucine-rich repeat and death domain-containing protein n=1 Tax=Danaus plexippus plexippus TaxID=278856 RepID=A0A212FID6_DANPL|nr:Leucine-rich repeat and death domain-containing protein [Danaus plexippus plexippus]
MDYKNNTNTVLHWNYRGFTEFPIEYLRGGVAEITDIYLKENLISRIPSDICKLDNLESLYLSGNDITELPREISKLGRLKCLDLSGNRLRCVPDEIGDMGSLKFLILDENELREIPLRIAELRMLRYLSVCDNKLEWLPQKPVYNYYHCEFRFWRNSSLKFIPYSLWYHMFREQQTRSLSIGCLGFPRRDDQHDKNCGQPKDFTKTNFEIKFPSNYLNILNKNFASPPSLLELCKRTFYKMLTDVTTKLNGHQSLIHSETNNKEFNNNITDLYHHFKDFNINNSNIYYKNSDEGESNAYTRKKEAENFFINRKGYCTPSDIIENEFYYLPRFIKEDLCNGPISKCENVNCKKSIFDYVYFEFCLEKIILIENTEEVVLSAALCSKTCAEKWRMGKAVINWT